LLGVPPLSPTDLDRYAETYYLSDPADDIDIEERAQRHSVPLILHAVEGCDRVLEMGVGTGLITGELRARRAGIEVLEGSPLLADQAGAAHPGLVVHRGLFETFAPAEPFDAVLALHVLEHVDTPGPLLARIASWLRPGGLHPRLADLSPRDRLVGHQRVYDLDGLHAEVADSFEVRAEFGYFLKPLANAQMLDWDAAVLDGLCVMSSELPARLLANIGVVAVKR
jgi:SAM-dependent methyltransferase